MEIIKSIPEMKQWSRYSAPFNARLSFGYNKGNFDCDLYVQTDGVNSIRFEELLQNRSAEFPVTR